MEDENITIEDLHNRITVLEEVNKKVMEVMEERLEAIKKLRLGE